VNLDQYPKKEFFEVPEHYFDELPNKVLNAIHQEKKYVLRKRLWMISSSVAAAMIVLLGVSFFLTNPNNDDNISLEVEKVEVDSLPSAVELAKSEDVSFPDMVDEESSSVKQERGTTSMSTPVEKIVKPSTEEPDFCNLDMQIIEYYSEDIVSNEYNELK